MTQAYAASAQGGHSVLFQPGRIGRMLLKNRIVMTAMGTLADNSDGTVSARAIDTYAERARGGVGMVITGGQMVSNKLEGWTFGMTTLDTDMQTKAWRLLTDRVKAFGARACVQLSPGLGRAGFAWPGMERVFPSASAIPSFYYPDILTRPMSIDDIAYIVGCMGRAAGRAKVAGFDAIEIHAHAGYMFDQFMTPVWNLRDDRYGGSFDNRMRLVTEAIDAIRSEVGPDFPLIFRFCMDHCFDGGRTVEQGQEIIRYLATRGIDAFDINIGSYDFHPSLGLSAYFGDDPLADAVKAARAATDLPILSAGNHTPDTAAAAVRDGQLDFVSLGRGLLADPDWANKVKAGRSDEVRPCIRCNEYCMNKVWEGMLASCAVNARCSTETEYPMTPAVTPRRIAVIGGGPAGLEAARVAAARGHRVDLYEAAGELGGNLRASTSPYKTQLAKLLGYYRAQLGNLGVTVHLNCLIEPADLQGTISADHVIVATGAKPVVPDLPGIDNANVMSVQQAYLSRRAEIGASLIIVGGNRVGCDAAIEFAGEARKVTVVAPEADIAGDASPDDRIMLGMRMAERGIEVLTSHRPLRFTASGVVVAGPDGQRDLAAQTVLYDFGRVADSDANEAFARAHGELVAIGDCDEVGLIGAAIRRGFFTAWAIN